jgi:Na+-transporting NADH:ubiquinone oxidoreductase subunit C
MAITTFVIAGLLATASQVLRPAQLRSIELDTKSQILGGVMELQRGDDVLAIYDRKIESIVVNAQGEEVETDAEGNPIEAENVDIARQFRVPPEQRLLPVFMFKSEDTDEIEAYIFPVYGVGLWDNIWGFIALETDLETIRGVRFAHAGETPGLGARITDIVVQERFIGKKIYDDLGEFVSVQMLRSERNPEDRLDEHNVDGMAGATITGRGVNDMIRNYFRLYDAYIQRIKAGQPS